MDAGQLAFADDAFDVVIAAFVISVVPDPIQVIAEIKRVSKPDGKIVIINHFQSQNKLIAQVEKWLSPLCKKNRLAFRPGFGVSGALCGVERPTNVFAEQDRSVESGIRE
jgi:phosphatidylethanolamine/phosphatidyl-N-methylethanolamine N-methyltransferase